MENKVNQELKGLLAEYFKYYRYSDAIEKIRNLRKNDSLNDVVWNKIKNYILEETLNNNEAYNLISFDANLPLDEDSNSEAHKWLKLFIRNIDNINEEIIKY